jgi:ABC-type Fe3+ transport system substrate-binding protein
MTPRRKTRLVGLFGAAMLIATACGSDDDSSSGATTPTTAAAVTTAAPASESSAAPTTEAPSDSTAATGSETSSPTESSTAGGGETTVDAAAHGRFDQLVADAKDSNHVVRMPYEGTFSDEQIKTLEDAFEQRFGFPLTIESEPGHPTREVPGKIITAAESGQGLVDGVDIASPNFLQIFDAGDLREPDWEALESEWPIIATLRADTMEATNSAGQSMSDVCMLEGSSPFIPVYNTDRVKPEEVADFKTWADLTDPKWQDRLVLDSEAAGIWQFPFAPGWDEQKMIDYATQIKGLNPTLVSGGTAAVVQALLQGEGDIGISTVAIADQQIAKGAPLGYVIPTDFVPVAQKQVCLVTPNVNNESMATLYLAWFDTEGLPLMAGSGGVPRLLPEEADKFPTAGKIADAGLTLDDLAYPRTREESEKQDEYRGAAKTALGSA